MAKKSSKWGKFWIWSSIWPGHDQSFHKTIGILTKVFYISGPNLVILAETGDALSHRQARDWHTDGHTDRQMQATTIPEGQNWPRVKKRRLK